MDPNASRVHHVHFAIFVAIERSCASIGSAVYAKKAINASFYTSTIWPKCPSVISIRDLMHATTKNARSFTSIPRARSKIVLGMIEVSVGMVRTVDIVTYAAFFGKPSAHAFWMITFPFPIPILIHLISFSQYKLFSWVLSGWCVL